MSSAIRQTIGAGALGQRPRQPRPMCRAALTRRAANGRAAMDRANGEVADLVLQPGVSTGLQEVLLEMVGGAGIEPATLAV